jgi:hypothetical protein
MLPANRGRRPLPVLCAGFCARPVRSAGLYSTAIASKGGVVCPLARFEGLGHAVTIPGAESRADSSR